MCNCSHFLFTRISTSYGNAGRGFLPPLARQSWHGQAIGTLPGSAVRARWLNSVAKAFLKAGKPVFLVVRQNLVRLVAASNKGLRRWVAVVAAYICEAEFRRLARQQTVFCVGDEITALYRQVTDRARKHLPSLVRYSDVLAAGCERSSGSVFPRLLCVGRLSREKGFSYAIDAISMLHDLDKEISLEIIGAGPMEEELRDHCRRRNVGRFVSFSGYIPYGPGLMERYRSAFALVVPSLTEGVT